MNETTEETYSVTDFGKDVAKSAGMAAVETAAAVAILSAAGFAVLGVQKLKDRRAAKKALKELN